MLADFIRKFTVWSMITQDLFLVICLRDNYYTMDRKLGNKVNHMMVSKNDLNELRRIATNTYDADKAFVNRVIRGISALEVENNRLKTEVESLKMQLHALRTV